MPNPIDRTGVRYGRLIVLREAPRTDPRRRRWVCLCDCGNEVTALGESLQSGHTKSCGCLVREAQKQNGINKRGKYAGANSPTWKGGIAKLKGVCASCGKPTWHRDVTQCKECSDNNRHGENNPFWGKFSSNNPQQGRDRAKRRKELGICEECKAAPAVDRHHRDDNPLNNEPSNIMGLCRRCHMIIDGRLDKLRE